MVCHLRSGLVYYYVYRRPRGQRGPYSVGLAVIRYGATSACHVGATTWYHVALPAEASAEACEGMRGMQAVSCHPVGISAECRQGHRHGKCFGETGDKANYKQNFRAVPNPPYGGAIPAGTVALCKCCAVGSGDTCRNRHPGAIRRPHSGH